VYLYLICCKDKVRIHGETIHIPRSRCAHVWMDDGMITPLCMISLFSYFILSMVTSFIFLFSFFLGHAPGKAFLFFILG
jgi:hypothetical protein